MSNSKFKIEFTLKQHTPMIHFQSSQKGATLRATELKPKLDRFLIKQLELEDENKKPKDEYKFWFVGEGKQYLALDYKVSVIATNSREINIENKLYFGNMGKDSLDSEFKKAIESEGIKVQIKSFNTDLIKKIKECFASFLVLNNFGTRQSKGFGSFYISEKDKENYIDPLKALDKNYMNYVYAKYGVDSSKVFSHVEVIYPLMKTGINFPDYKKKDHPEGYTDRNGNIKKIPDPSQGRGVKASYYKSYLFQYMLEKIPSIGNEKKFIKENFFNNEVRVNKDNINKKYIRALLGVSDGVEFKDHERRGKVEYTSPEIDRFKSPLTFKVINSQMIIIANEIDENIFDKEFTFSYNNNEKISTPTKDDFDINDFLYSFVDYFNNTLKVDKPKDKQNIFDKKILEAKKTKFIKVSK